MNDTDLLENQAIDAAIALDWKRAIELNSEIIKHDKQNLSGYLRLGFAHLQLNKFNDAKKYYTKVLRIQPGNPLAKDNLERIRVLEGRRNKKNDKRVINFDPNLFLEIMGRTKSVPLVNLGQKNVLAHLTIGEEIYLKPKSRKIEIRTKSNEYIGSLPDDLSKRLLLFTKAGSAYEAFIKDVNLSRVVVFVKELKKGSKVHAYLSFPKDSQQSLSKIEASDDDGHEHEGDEAQFDIERLAESIVHEDKEYFHYSERGEDEDEENIEE